MFNIHFRLFHARIMIQQQVRMSFTFEIAANLTKDQHFQWSKLWSSASSIINIELEKLKVRYFMH